MYSKNFHVSLWSSFTMCNLYALLASWLWVSKKNYKRVEIILWTVSFSFSFWSGVQWCVSACTMTVCTRHRNCIYCRYGFEVDQILKMTYFTRIFGGLFSCTRHILPVTRCFLFWRQRTLRRVMNTFDPYLSNVIWLLLRFELMISKVNYSLSVTLKHLQFLWFFHDLRQGVWYKIGPGTASNTV